jgi:hypothetical protein
MLFKTSHSSEYPLKIVNDESRILLHIHFFKYIYPVVYLRKNSYCCPTGKHIEKTNRVSA